MQLSYVGAIRKRILVYAKAIWVWEVVGELAMHLENVAIVNLAFYWNLGFQWTIWNVSR